LERTKEPIGVKVADLEGMQTLGQLLGDSEASSDW
jgi:hypothetical protein